jgi:uncharacterized membrane protein YecN with MAPEG domain
MNKRSLRERYRLVVSVLIIPLGAIIVVRASMAGIQAWTLIILGLAFMSLGVVRLWTYRRDTLLRDARMQKGK